MGRTSTYPIEFREQAAALVIDGGRGVREVARELGIKHETLRNWVTHDRRTAPPVPAPSPRTNASSSPGYDAGSPSSSSRKRS